MRYVDTFAGFEIADWQPGQALGDPATWMPHLEIDGYTDTGDWLALFDALVATPGSERLQGLSIGSWGENQDPTFKMLVAPHLLAHAARLPALRALVVANMSYQTCEISWIHHTDLAPVIHAFPTLEHVKIIGSHSLWLAGLRAPGLKTLSLVSGGLPRTVVHDVLSADLPRLTRLELYTGDEEYGADTTVDDLAPLLDGHVHPHLTHLAVANCGYADEVAARLTRGPRLDRLEVLDLSQGALTDSGGEALLSDPRLTGLQRLDLHHHYLSPPMVERFAALDLDVDLGDPQEPRTTYKGAPWYPVAIGE